MDDETFPYDKIILTLNLDNHKNKILNTTCSSNKSDNNYILSCNSTREIKEKIITGFATFENENLFVNVTEQTGFSSSKFNFFSTKKFFKNKCLCNCRNNNSFTSNYNFPYFIILLFEKAKSK